MSVVICRSCFVEEKAIIKPAAEKILAVADFSISKPNRMEAKNYLKQSQAKTIFIQEKSGFDRKVILYSEAKRLRSGSGR